MVFRRGVRSAVAVIAVASLAGCSAMGSIVAGDARPRRPRTQPLRAELANGPVPAGFVPVSVSAIDAEDYWVLGTAPCGDEPCTSLLRTEDGGRHFVALGAPVAELAEPAQYLDRADDETTDLGGDGVAAKDTVTDVVFANQFDGYAYGNALFVTRDGGLTWTWQPGAGSVADVAVGGGAAYALRGGDSGWQVSGAPLGSDSWRPLAVQPILRGARPGLVVSPDGRILLFGDGTRGRTVADISADGTITQTVIGCGVDGNAANAANADNPANPANADNADNAANADAYDSADDAGAATGDPTSAGYPIATGGASTWLVCPEPGEGSAIWRSNGAGAFHRLAAPGTRRGAVLAASGQNAVLGAGASLWYTHDDGVRWRRADLAGPIASGLRWRQLVYTSSGTVLGVTTGSRSELWRSMDAGVTWRLVSI
jgi:hypothetical protein